MGFGLASSASLSDTLVACAEVRHSRMLEAVVRPSSRQANPNMDSR